MSLTYSNMTYSWHTHPMSNRHKIQTDDLSFPTDITSKVFLKGKKPAWPKEQVLQTPSHMLVLLLDLSQPQEWLRMRFNFCCMVERNVWEWERKDSNPSRPIYIVGNLDVYNVSNVNWDWDLVPILSIQPASFTTEARFIRQCTQPACAVRVGIRVSHCCHSLIIQQCTIFSAHYTPI